MSKRCPNCGNELNDNARFCIRCGRNVLQTASPGQQGMHRANMNYQAQQQQVQRQNSNVSINDMVIDGNEQIQAMVKNSGLLNLILGQGLRTQKMYYTNQRFYYRDKFWLLGNDRFVAVPLHNIAATELLFVRNFIWLVLGILVWIQFFSIYTKYRVNIGGIGLLIAFVLSILCFVFYYFSNRACLVVNCAGARNVFKLRAVPFQEMKQFHDNLQQLIERRNR